MSTEIRVGEYTFILRDIAPADQDAVLALHQRVFGGSPDAAWFAWKYGQQPAQGRGQAMGAWLQGELVAFCAGMPRQLLLGGTPVAGLQIGDVMVHPDWRGLFTRRGPFFHVSNALYDSRLGAVGERRFQLGFGFPSARHLKLAVMLGLLHDVGSMEELHWDLPQQQDTAVPWPWKWQALRPDAPEFDATVNRAWQAMQKDAGELLLGERNAAYVRWRFVDRPACSYQFFMLRHRWPGSRVGVAVMDLHDPNAHWLDWVGPLAWMPRAAGCCKAQVRAQGGTSIRAWVSQPVAHALQASGISRKVVCAGIGMPTRSTVRMSDAWFMGGDTDFL